MVTNENKTDLKVNMQGVDGNVFVVVGHVSRELRNAGYKEYSDEVYDRMQKSKSYDEVLMMLQEYVEFVFEEDDQYSRFYGGGIN